MQMGRIVNVIEGEHMLFAPSRASPLDFFRPDNPSDWNCSTTGLEGATFWCFLGCFVAKDPTVHARARLRSLL